MDANRRRRPSEPGTLLAFDFGTRRIGVAIGNRVTRMAQPLTTIDAEATALRFEAIATLIDRWLPERLLVGRPLHLDGTAHEMTARADRFARQLEGRFGVPVTQVDERLTTQEAQATLGESGVTGAASRQLRDAVAAQLMLQSYFDGEPAAGGIRVEGSS